MRILVHSEPMVLCGHAHHLWFWQDMLLRIAGQVTARGVPQFTSFHLVANLAMADRASTRQRLPVSQVTVMPGALLADATGLGPAGALKALADGNTAVVDAMAEVYRALLPPGHFDLVLTNSPSAALWHRLYPGSVVLHAEGGPVTRAPYPFLFFLDPWGMYGSSAPARLGLWPGGAEDGWLEDMTLGWRRQMSPASRAGRKVTALRERWQKLILLPLQFSGHFGWTQHSGFAHQGAFFWDFIERIPPEWAVIVTEHEISKLVGEAVDAHTRHLVSKYYPNVIFADTALMGLTGQSLVPLVDIIASVSSSVGVQAALHGIPLLALGNSHLATYATWTSVGDMLEQPDRQPPPMAGALSWLLTDYSMPLSRSLDGVFLEERLLSLMRGYRKWKLDPSPERMRRTFSPAAGDLGDLVAGVTQRELLPAW
ncbi:hypothetical protein [Radicibacter daui]|uniref:hypothetical protein n=1 Tax=Radicibacter daui TaxID=3064829 RepID=UPI0040469181